MELSVYRDLAGETVLVGTLAQVERQTTFRYDSGYLVSSEAAPLSLSLPLRESPFDEKELTPYFRGLLPEGTALENLCRSMGIAESDYFGMLAACGLDCLGDIVINPDAYAAQRRYQPLETEDVLAMAGSPDRIVRSLEAARLSLAGTQNKCGLFHDPSAPMETGWFQPAGGAPSNAIVKFARADLPDLMQVEHLCMASAARCGLRVARTWLLDPSNPVLCVERFDRLSESGEVVDGVRAPMRRHQEDLTQAFGLLPSAKYRELKPHSAQVIADFLRSRSASPAKDLRSFVELMVFNYLIGNCDNHLKNMAILYAPDWRSFSLAPFYDLVSTTYFARFSREMGMAIGTQREIDQVTMADFGLLAKQVGVSASLAKGIARKISKAFPAALREEADALGKQGFAVAPYIADDMLEDVAPRLHILANL